MPRTREPVRTRDRPFLIGDVCAKSGLSQRTVRHYRDDVRKLVESLLTELGIELEGQRHGGLTLGCPPHT